MDSQTVDEIAALLDQCSSEELENILATVSAGEDENMMEPSGQPPEPPVGSSPQVVPPSGPPPPSGGRRPAPAGLRRTEATNERTESAEQEMEPSITMSEAKQLLNQHSVNLMAEVGKVLPYIGAVTDGGVTVDTLTQILAMRDQQVKELETELGQLQAELAAKGRRVSDLTGELDMALREVRHKQLDVEFQQLKLEERIRGNAELELKQKGLLMRVEEAGMNAKHAALDVEMGRPVMGAGAARLQLQGSLSWMVRRNRPIAFR